MNGWTTGLADEAICLPPNPICWEDEVGYVVKTDVLFKWK